MKPSLLTLAAVAAAASLHGAALSVPTAVQSRPDPAAPVLLILQPGAEPPAPATGAPPAPDGWAAVQVTGPFEGYVRNRDLSKQLEVVPGASIYQAPRDGSPVLATFEKGDKAQITGLHGSWTQVRLDKTLVGYIQVAAAAPAPPAPGPVPAEAAPPPAPSAPASAAAPAAPDETLARLFEGTLASTRSLLSPHRPFDWQLSDPSGKRIAYVDLHKLLLTDQIENYAGHPVSVLGTLKAVPGTPDLVILVDGLRLK